MDDPTSRKVLLPTPLAHQVEVLRHPARSKVVVCGRRWGKTIAGLIAVVEGHGPERGTFRGALDGGQIWWVAPSFPIAVLIWQDLKKALRGAWAEKKEKQWMITLPGGGSVTVKSADDPDALRGVGLDGVVLDEAAFMQEAAWTQGIRPALADRRGWAIFLTTPKGQNWVYDLYGAAESAPGWARWRRPTSDNPRIAVEELAAARAELGSYAYAQEFEAQFVTPGGGLFQPQWFLHRYERLGEDRFRLQDGTVVALGDLRRFATVDLAASVKTTADYSVVMVFGATADRRLLVLDVDRARREGPDLVPAMRRAVERWRLSAVWVEKSGFQLALVQQAAREGLPVRELVPDRDKVSRALPATAALEGGRVLLPVGAPWVRDLEAELLAFPHGTHDDQVDTFSYGVAVLRGLYSELRVAVGQPPRPRIGRLRIWDSDRLDRRAPRPRPDLVLDLAVLEAEALAEEQARAREGEAN